MKILIVVVVLLGLLLSVSAQGDTCQRKTVADDSCALEGTWMNELGSTAVFTTCAGGQLNGTYKSAVGNATDLYLFSGRYTVSGPNNDVIVAGWSVAWNNTYGNSNSTTSWTGLYYPEGDKILYTQYILVVYVDKANLWQSSLLYHDEFKKVSECNGL